MVLKSRMIAPDWSAGGDEEMEAKCRKYPLPSDHDVTPETDPFFYDEEEASHVCNGTYDNKVCPFRATCLHLALVNNEGSGTFGGFTPEQRKWIRKQRRNPNLEETITRDEWDMFGQRRWRDRVPSHQEIEEMILAEAAANEQI